MQGVPGSQGVPSAHYPPATFNPFIYGNDVDSVDVATRVAMVGGMFKLRESVNLSVLCYNYVKVQWVVSTVFCT